MAMLAVGWCATGAYAQAPGAEGPLLERLPAVEAAWAVPEEVPVPAAVVPPVAEGDKKVAEIVVSETEEVVVPPAVPKLWSGSFDLGLNGSSGNTDLFNLRFNLAAIRETESTKLTLKSNYIRLQSDGEEAGNRLFFEGRNEWKFGESPWSIYGHQTTEYDEFRNWRTRIGMDTGLGYALIKNDFTSLTARFGPSVSHEFRGPTTDWVPELAYGLQLEHKLNELQKLMFQIDYFPSLLEFKDYRMNTQASWEIVLDKVNNLSLKLSAISRYDSTPDDGQGPDDLDYAATLLWAF